MENYPLSEKISTILNKNISKSQIITRSTRNNTLRPEIGSKLQKSNLLGQGAYLWNEVPLDFKTAKTYQNIPDYNCKYCTYDCGESEYNFNC